MSKKNLYEERVKNFTTTINLSEPERVPIVLEAAGWVIDYCGCTTQYILDHPELMADKLTKVFDDIYCDLTAFDGPTRSLHTLNILGSEGYVISKDRVTIQHIQNCRMKADEYDQLIADPNDFIINVLSLRKLKNLKGSDDEIYEILKRAAVTLRDFSNGAAALVKKIEEEYGILQFFGPRKIGAPPIDLIFDKLRGFRETLVDIKRQPEKVLAAVEAIYAQTNAPTVSASIKRLPTDGILPLSMMTFHAVPFLNRKEFEKFFWPILKKTVMPFAEAGGKVLLVSENDSTYAFDYFKDFPKGSFIFQFEMEDPYAIYKNCGAWASFACGIKLNHLKYLSKQECLDIAKKAVDTFAPGGGYIFCTDKALTCANDVKVENLIAVHDFVRDYGKY